MMNRFALRLAPIGGLAVILSLLAACQSGNGYDYDRYARDPFSYAADFSGSRPDMAAGAATSGAPSGLAADTARPIDGSVFDRRLDEARRQSRPDARRASMPDAQEAYRPASGDPAVQAAERRRRRLGLETPRDSLRTADDIARDRREANVDLLNARRASELDYQRELAIEGIMARQRSIDRGAFDASDALHRRALEGHSVGISDNRRSTIGRMPNVGRVTLP